MDNLNLLDTKKTAQLLGLSPKTLMNYRCIGGGPPFIRITVRCIRYRKKDLLDWLASREKKSTSEY